MCMPGVIVAVCVVVPVRVNRVYVCFESVRVVVLMFRRRVRTVLTTGLVVSVQDVAIRSSLPDIVGGEGGVLCVGGGRRKVRCREGVAVAVTVMVALRVGAQREGIARSHVDAGSCKGRSVCRSWCCKKVVRCADL